MATVSLSPAPLKLRNMSNRRIPLGDIPNVANSPLRAVAHTTMFKRSRDHVEAQEGLSFAEQPAAKRQAVNIDRTPLRRSPRKQNLQLAEERVFGRRPANAQPTAFERKLLAAREARASQKVDRQEKAPQETLEGIRQWQRHYKKAFPHFVFYFEGIAEDIRVKCSRHVRALGAREEKFFSKEVTHVVTTRSIPTDNDSREASQAVSNGTGVVQPRTIDPSLLDRQVDPPSHSIQTRSKFTFEASMNKKAATHGLRDTETRKPSSGGVDILFKAKEMGMKVWQLEKLQRIIDTMYDVPNDPQPQPGLQSRTRTNASTKADRAEDLSRMLHNERVHGPSDRDATLAASEMKLFNGPYIYIRDMDERTKPIMVKEFPKPARTEKGIWPQFHPVSLGKCPFVPELDRQEIVKMKKQQKEPSVQRVETRSVSRSRTTIVREDTQDKGDLATERRQALEEINNEAQIQGPPLEKPAIGQFCPPPFSKTRSPLKATTKIVPTAPRLFGGEPAASGLQPSNITSAIRSQVISSTSAAPGAKAGTSKEVHGLKRKVLEKNAGPAPNTMQTRQKTLDATRAEKTIAVARWAQKSAGDHLRQIAEERSISEENEDVWMAEEARVSKSAPAHTQPVEKRNPKPGYCENCQDKYEDFDKHIYERKHRKFALSSENWKELDHLLSHLSRRLLIPRSIPEDF